MNGPQDLIVVSAPAMHLGSLCLFTGYANSYQKSTVTMGHSVHNTDVSKMLTHTAPGTLPAICPLQLKSGLKSVKTTVHKCASDHFAHSCPKQHLDQCLDRDVK